MTVTPILETERLLLRRPAPRDVEGFIGLMTSERARHMGGPKTRAEAWRGFCTELAHWDIRGYGMFAVTIPAGLYDVIFNPPPPPASSHLILEIEEVQSVRSIASLPAPGADGDELMAATLAEQAADAGRFADAARVAGRV